MDFSAEESILIALRHKPPQLHLPRNYSGTTVKQALECSPESKLLHDLSGCFIWESTTWGWVFWSQESMNFSHTWRLSTPALIQLQIFDQIYDQTSRLDQANHEA